MVMGVVVVVVVTVVWVEVVRTASTSCLPLD